MSWISICFFFGWLIVFAFHMFFLWLAKCLVWLAMDFHIVHHIIIHIYIHMEFFSSSFEFAQSIFAVLSHNEQCYQQSILKIMDVRNIAERIMHTNNIEKQQINADEFVKAFIIYFISSEEYNLINYNRQDPRPTVFLSPTDKKKQSALIRKRNRCKKKLKEIYTFIFEDAIEEIEEFLTEHAMQSNTSGNNSTAPGVTTVVFCSMFMLTVFCLSV